jgi:hypothetical protein
MMPLLLGSTEPKTGAGGQKGDATAVWFGDHGCGQQGDKNARGPSGTRALCVEQAAVAPIDVGGGAPGVAAISALAARLAGVYRAIAGCD